jgi:hypothetical protein
MRQIACCLLLRTPPAANSFAAALKEALAAVTALLKPAWSEGTGKLGGGVALLPPAIMASSKAPTPHPIVVLIAMFMVVLTAIVV